MVFSVFSIVVVQLMIGLQPLLIPTLAQSPPSTTVTNKYGSPCSSNSSCSLNEHCVTESRMTPPCNSGICDCLPNHGVFMDCDLHTRCTIIDKRLGDSCCQWTVSSGHVRIPFGSHCNKDGIVACRRHFHQNGTVCETVNRILVGQVCKDHEECSDGGMVCGNNRICQCSADNLIYDMDKGYCVKRSFGDPCFNNAMCQAYAINVEQGYTYSSGACNLPQGTCYCGNNTQVEVSYRNQLTGQLRNKTICVPKTANVSLDIGDSCHPDPIYYSVVDPAVQICRAGLVCLSCPEDENHTFGKCRLLYDDSDEVNDIVTTTAPPSTTVKASTSIPPSASRNLTDESLSTTTKKNNGNNIAATYSSLIVINVSLPFLFF